MSFIDNIKNDIEEASARYELMNDKIMLFESVAYNNYIIKQKEAYLDAYKYGGDMENYFTESDGDGFGTRIKSTIKKIGDSLKEFLQKCKEKIIELMQKIRESSLVQKLESLFKANPSASNIKVEITDESKKINLLEKARDSLKKQKARMKSGKISQNDSEEIEERNNKIAVICAASGALIAVTLGAVLMMIKKGPKESQSALKFDADEYKAWEKMVDSADKAWIQEKEIKLPKDVAKRDWNTSAGNLPNMHKKLDSITLDYTPEMGHIITSAASQESKLQQFIAKLHVNKFSELLNAARTGLSSIGNDAGKSAESVQGKNEVTTPSVESAYEDSFDADDYFSELCNDIFGDDTSTEDDFDTMYSELCNDIFF